MKGIWSSKEAKEKTLSAVMDETLDVVLRYNNIAQEVIVYAAMNNKAVKVINLGAGAKRIISMKDTCPVCGKKS